jgi:hypothetical protein
MTISARDSRNVPRLPVLRSASSGARTGKTIQLLRNEACKNLGDFRIPHFLEEFPAVRENEIPIEGRHGRSIQREGLDGHGEALRARTFRAPRDAKSCPRGHPALKTQGARPNRNPDPACDPVHGPVRRLQHRRVQDPRMQASRPSFHRHVRKKPRLHAVADATKRQPQAARVARAATKARIRTVVLQRHARSLVCRRPAPPDHLDNPYKASASVHRAPPMLSITVI